MIYFQPFEAKFALIRIGYMGGRGEGGNGYMGGRGEWLYGGKGGLAIWGKGGNGYMEDEREEDRT